MSVILCPCILCVVLLVYLFVLCAAWLTVFVNCLYVCCSECNVVCNECDDPTSCLVQHIGMRGVEVM